MIPTRAISLHAPWAWAIMHAGKDIENRSKSFPRRHKGEAVVGRVWIHASLWPGAGTLWAPAVAAAPLKWNKFFAEFETAIHLAQLRGSTFTEHHWPDANKIRGHIVGSVYVEGYQAPDEPPDSPWYVPGSLAILVRDPRPLEKPVPAKGALGWWSPPDDVMSELRREVTP